MYKDSLRPNERRSDGECHDENLMSRIRGFKLRAKGETKASVEQSPNRPIPQGEYSRCVTSSSSSIEVNSLYSTTIDSHAPRNQCSEARKPTYRDS